jgi:hypothetical protein
MQRAFLKFENLGYRKFVKNYESSGDISKKLAEIAEYSIPQDYLQFLNDFPCTGTFDIDVYCLGLESSPWAPDALYPTLLFFASCSQKSEDLIFMRENPLEAWDFDSSMLVIADSSGGNYFCMSLKKETFGKVYFWDHDHSETETGLYLLANNFTSFIEQLHTP